MNSPLHFPEDMSHLSSRGRESVSTEDLVQLFDNWDVKVPSSKEAAPFEPSRTVNVSSTKWEYYRRQNHRREGQQMFGSKKEHKIESQKQIKDNPYVSIFGFPVLYPDSVYVHTWSFIITVVDLTYTSFFVPISIAFDQVFEGLSFTWLTGVDCGGTAFYIVDMMMEFHTGFIAKYDVHRMVVCRGRDVALKYIRSWQFWIDLMAVLAIVPEIVSSLVANVSSSAYKALYLLRLLRMARVLRIVGSIFGTSVLSTPFSRVAFRRLNTAGAFLLNMLYILAVSVNLMGCMWWFLAELEGLESSWAAGINDLTFDLLTANDPTRYVVSVYFAITVLTTVGFGDIVPRTVAEMCLAGFYMLCSLFYFGYVVNGIGSLLNELSVRTRSATALRAKLEDIETWLVERHIPESLGKQVIQYYLEIWAPQGGGLKDEELFRELPMALRGRIVAKLAGHAMRASHMLRTLPQDVIAHLAASAIPRRLVAGRDLYREGDSADKFWILQEGETKIFRGMQVTGGIRAPAILGQAAIFAPWVQECRERMHTVRALSSCTLWEFDNTALSRIVKHHPNILLSLYENYLNYLDEYEKWWSTSNAAQQGFPLPQRIPRIKVAIQKLYDKTHRQVVEGRGGKEISGQAEVVGEVQGIDVTIPDDTEQQDGSLASGEGNAVSPEVEYTSFRGRGWENTNLSVQEVSDDRLTTQARGVQRLQGDVEAGN